MENASLKAVSNEAPPGRNLKGSKINGWNANLVCAFTVFSVSEVFPPTVWQEAGKFASSARAKSSSSHMPVNLGKDKKVGWFFFLLLKKTGAITMLSRVPGKKTFFSSLKPRPTFRVQRHPSRKGVNKWREQADANWNCLLVHFNYSSWCFPLQLCGREETTWKLSFFTKPPFFGWFWARFERNENCGLNLGPTGQGERAGTMKPLSELIFI